MHDKEKWILTDLHLNKDNNLIDLTNKLNQGSKEIDINVYYQNQIIKEVVGEILQAQLINMKVYVKILLYTSSIHTFGLEIKDDTMLSIPPNLCV